MMIEYGAFQNCSSLEEIHFEKCTNAVNTNIYNSNVPKTMKIIVHDKFYKNFFDNELPANRYRILPYSEYIQQKIDNRKHSNIILSIIYLYDIVQLDIDKSIKDNLLQICSLLKNKYQISEKTISHIKYLKDKKQEIEDESRL